MKAFNDLAYQIKKKKQTIEMLEKKERDLTLLIEDNHDIVDKLDRQFKS